jgi:hypothetical protein
LLEKLVPIDAMKHPDQARYRGCVSKPCKNAGPPALSRKMSVLFFHINLRRPLSSS